MNGGRLGMWRPTGKRREWESFQAKNGTYRSQYQVLGWGHQSSLYSMISLCCTLICGFVLWKNSVLKFKMASHLKKFLFIVKPWDFNFCGFLYFLFFYMAASFFQSRMKVWYDDVLLYRYRVDRKERARLKNVKFTGKTSEKVKRVYIQSIELQLSSTYLHVITVIINWLNAYSTTF